MKKLPVGIASFKMFYQQDLLYVDKTGHLINLITNGSKYFLSRPRRFGKSLTLSIIDAMFSGKAELFQGLKAEDWVKKQAKNPSPVLRFDMSTHSAANGLILDKSLREMIAREARNLGIKIYSDLMPNMLIDLLEGVYKQSCAVVILIDEYDKPILDCVDDISKADEMRNVLRDFYTIIKSCSDAGYIRFVMITGISKFSKTGVFSAMNDLLDISLMEDYSDIVGYTQEELEYNFADWINVTAERKNLSREELLSRLEEYYDGFSFDGNVRIYNPFSILNFFSKGRFRNYWYESGSPSFIVKWMEKHKIQAPEDYRHKVVDEEFADSQEIERADPSSFLFQSGYLTIEKRTEELITLDYPNREVLDSISKMYLRLVYKINNYALLGNEIWAALREGNLSEIVKLYNTALAGIAYDDFSLNKRNEFWYRSMFVMLLRGAGIISYSEPHLSKGRPDVVIQFKDKVIILEFKFAEKEIDIDRKSTEGEKQVQEKMYTEAYATEGRNVLYAVLVANDETRQVVNL